MELIQYLLIQAHCISFAYHLNSLEMFKSQTNISKNHWLLCWLSLFFSSSLLWVLYITIHPFTTAFTITTDYHHTFWGPFFRRQVSFSSAHPLVTVSSTHCGHNQKKGFVPSPNLFCAQREFNLSLSQVYQLKSSIRDMIEFLIFAQLTSIAQPYAQNEQSGFQFSMLQRQSFVFWRRLCQYLVVL